MIKPKIIPILKNAATHPSVETCHGTSLQDLAVALLNEIGIS